MLGNLKPNNVIRVPCDLDGLFRYWLAFLTPFHNLTAREMDVATAFLKERYMLSKGALDDTTIDRVLMSDEFQKKIRLDCNLTNQHFQVIKSKLKSKKFFINDKINSRLIPCVKEDKGYFQLLLLFDYSK